MFDEATQEPRRWVTRADVEYINSLCPNAAEFPVPAGFEGVEGRLQHAFHSGFLRLRDEWRSSLIRCVGEINKSELKVLLAIERKTFSFSKLMEKMPRRLFTQGERNVTGKHRRNNVGSPVLLSTGIDDRNLGKAISGLVAKRKISRIVSDPHPLYGVSSIYSPMPIRTALNDLIKYSAEATDPMSEDDELYEAMMAICGELENRCSGLFSEAELRDSGVGEVAMSEADASPCRDDF